MAAPDNNNIDRIRGICMELENVRHHLNGILFQMRDVVLGGTNEELFYLINGYATYLAREFELEYELKIGYNFFYRRYL